MPRGVNPRARVPTQISVFGDDTRLRNELGRLTAGAAAARQYVERAEAHEETVRRRLGGPGYRLGALLTPEREARVDSIMQRRYPDLARNREQLRRAVEQIGQLSTTGVVTPPSDTGAEDGGLDELDAAINSVLTSRRDSSATRRP